MNDSPAPAVVAARRALAAAVVTCALGTPLGLAAAKKGAPKPTPTPTAAPAASSAPSQGITAPKRKLAGGIAAPADPGASSSPSTQSPVPTPLPFGEGSSIADAARRSREAKENREKKAPSLGVITNETLKKGSTASGAGTASTSRGTLSVAPARTGESQPAPLPTVGAVTDLQGRTEKDWRERVSGLRTKAAAAEAEVKRLEEETRRLENDFFAWSDGNYRDGVIKPAWDKAKGELRTARENLDGVNQELADLDEEARKSGAPPGWLR